jgi:hypothetical protein
VLWPAPIAIRAQCAAVERGAGSGDAGIKMEGSRC